MHQDSKTFSDITDIDPAKKLKVHLILETQGAVDFNVTLNNNSIIDMESVNWLDLFDDVDLTIKIDENKNFGVVIIKSLKINEKEILPLYQHKASSDTCWIRQGEWNYYIPGPFYTWYHITSGQGWIA